MLQTTLSKMALCVAGGAVAAMTAAGPATAVAAPTLPDGGGKVYKGWTTDDTKVRQWPSHRARVIDYIREHRKVYVKCEVRKGGDTWYKLAKRSGWVNSDTVRVRGHVPHCRWVSGNDSSMNDQPVNNAGVEEDASLYPAPTGQTAGEPLG